MSRTGRPEDWGILGLSSLAVEGLIQQFIGGSSKSSMTIKVCVPPTIVAERRKIQKDDYSLFYKEGQVFGKEKVKRQSVKSIFGKENKGGGKHHK